MKSFSDLEKKIIWRLINSNGSSPLSALGDIFESLHTDFHLPYCCYISVESDSDVHIQVRTKDFESNNFDWTEKIYSIISTNMLVTVILFEYLHDSKLAYFVGQSGGKKLGFSLGAATYTACDFLESDTKALIYKYAGKEVYLTETLKVMAKNNFKSAEEVRHKNIQDATNKQLRFTQAALALTFAGLIASILIPLFSITEVRVNNDTIIMSIDEASGEKLRRNVFDKSVSGNNENKVYERFVTMENSIKNLRIDMRVMQNKIQTDNQNSDITLSNKKN